MENATKTVAQRPSPYKPERLLPAHGHILLETLIDDVNVFFKLRKSRKDYKKLFSVIFGSLGDHMYEKQWDKDFGHWFLNMDDKCQIAFLQTVSSATDLEYPPIDNFTEHCSSFISGDISAFSERQLRSLALGFGILSQWELYPADLVWFRRFALYAYNHSIPDEQFKGDRYGNYANWSKYYLQLTIAEQKKLCETLIDYK